MTWITRFFRRASPAPGASLQAAPTSTDADAVKALRLYYQDYYIPCLSSELARDEARAVIEQQVLDMELPKAVERELLREIPEWLGIAQVPLVQCDYGHVWHENPPEVPGFRDGDPCPHQTVIGQGWCGRPLHAVAVPRGGLHGD